ncbi:serine/threonine-protein kinase [Spirillospora sp. NPDC048911]|uniref:serine/threonine-protein kinase n=1 Tax=Spirillospora sp. NPDC048911 TaxID=3364527 RepID=UPI00370FA3CA
MGGDLGRMLAGRYRLLALLGEGGTGAVWRARDERLDREVAAKQVRPPARPDAGWPARLDREAGAAARLAHPGIVRVHDRITGEDGRPWIVMELLRGCSLEALLRTGGPLPPERVAGIGLQLLGALGAAHLMGVTHRGIKPANVMLDGDDRAVLTDFGMAAASGEVVLTRPGPLVGTPAFLAPEQVGGLPGTAESDLWSLGATLFAAVEGRPPFSGDCAGAVCVAIATRRPARPLRAGPLEPALTGLLRRNPADRLSLDQVRELLIRECPARRPVRDGAPDPDRRRTGERPGPVAG